VLLRRSVSASARPPPSLKPQLLRLSTVTLYHAFKPFTLSRRPRPGTASRASPHNCICLFYGRAHRLRRLAQRNCPARGQHLVVDSGKHRHPCSCPGSGPTRHLSPPLRNARLETCSCAKSKNIMHTPKRGKAARMRRAVRPFVAPVCVCSLIFSTNAIVSESPPCIIS
jgi:hypothetical protein